MAARDLIAQIVIRARNEASGVLGSVQQALGGVGVKVAALGAAITSYLGVRLFADAVDGARDFEAQMATVGAVSGATAAEMAALKAAAEEMGASTRYTATEAAGALENLARAGLSATDSITALPSVLALAQGNGIELAQAAELVTKTVAGMGLAVGESGRVADVLTKAAASANTNVLGLGQALSYAAPLAKSLGISLEETVAIIGKFADAGIDASRAGTALNSILAQFSDPASKFRQELGAAGIITTDFNLALRQLADAGPAGQKAINAVGQEAGPALRALLNQGVGALDALTGKLREAGGAAQQAAARMSDNLDGAVRSAGSAWDAFKLKLADPVLPVLQEQFSTLAARIQGLVSSGVASRFGEAIATAFQAAGKWVDEFIQKADFSALSDRMSAFASQSQEVFSRLGGYATTAGGVMQTAWGVMTTGINTVMAVIYTMAEAFAGVASNITSGLAIITEGLSKVTFGGLSASFAAAAEEIRTTAGGMWAVSEEFARKSEQAFADATAGAETAAEGWRKVTEQVGAAAPEVERIEPAVRAVAEAADQASASVVAMGSAAQASAAVQQAAAAETAAKVAELRSEYARMLSAGDTQGAASKLQEINGLLKQTASQARSTGDEIENAFSRLGIKSQASLQQLADAARRDYEIIKSSGIATAADLQAAFAAYAEKAIAANGGVASEAIRVQAEMQGIAIEAGAAGDAVAGAMGAAAAATGSAADQAARLASAQQRVSASGGSGRGGSGFGGGGGDGVSSPQNYTRDDLERLLNPPGGGGGVGNLPIGLTKDQLSGLTLTRAELEDYGLNSAMSAADRAAGLVNRSVRTTVANESFIRQQAYGVYGLKDQAQVDEFVARYGDAISKGWAKAAVGMDPNLTALESGRRIAVGSNAAVKELADEIKRNASRSGNATDGIRRLGGGTGSAQGATSHTVTVNIGGKSRTISAASSADASALVGVIKDLEAAASRLN